MFYTKLNFTLFYATEILLSNIFLFNLNDFCYHLKQLIIQLYHRFLFANNHIVVR